RYAPTRLVTRCNSRFQSNHQRGYFCRNRIMSSGARNNTPPAVAVVYVAWPWADHCHSCPDTAPRTIAMGMTVKIRNPVVRRLRGRAGESTEKLTGYESPSIAMTPFARVLRARPAPSCQLRDPKSAPVGMAGRWRG